MGWPPAAGEDYNGLFHVEQPEAADAPADACGVRLVRRYVNPGCMTRSDHEGHERDLQMGRLGLPVFHVEQPGVLVYCGSVDANDYMCGQAEAAAHARAMGEAHQQRMLKRRLEIQACVGMQQGDSGWRDWNDG
jgi:hypothetical protein